MAIKIPKAPKMNKTEKRYSKRLDLGKYNGEIMDWEFEGRTLQLAERCKYTPDFFVGKYSGILEYHEVKGGFVRDDARVKFKCASRIYRFARFIWAQWTGRVWKFEEWMGGECIERWKER